MAKTQTQPLSQDAIKLRSYEIWQREGCPHGADMDHWLRAEAELTTENCAKPARRKTAAKALGKKK
jgi:hypothetical protein